MSRFRLRPKSAPSAQIWVGARPLSEASASISATIGLVWTRRVFLVIWVGAFALCGVAYVKLLRPDYVATTQILLQPRVIVNDGPEDERHFHQFMMDTVQCETELRVLRSEQLLYRVFNALELAKSPEIRNGPDGFWAYIGDKIARLERFVASGHDSLEAFYAFAGRVRSRRLSLSYVIEISYRAQSAEQAARVVNSIASAYAAYRLRGALAREQRRGVYLERRLEKLQGQMLAAEAGMRFGEIPEGNLADAEVRLLGPANKPLGTAYPKMVPIVAMMILFGCVSGLLIIIMPNPPSSKRKLKAGVVSNKFQRARVA
ncbi:Wzz/FepE/Etk N-terminal domain-containing protein [Methylobacterium sp. NFXW15]|uniref:Wzz/FepE/Etk N-terminal domain-containing protein n=1 Tax=Methylobacterium sp. NFXW15 TaxID=2819512 RepID=UPI003CEA92BE